MLFQQGAFSSFPPFFCFGIVAREDLKAACAAHPANTNKEEVEKTGFSKSAGTRNQGIRATDCGLLVDEVWG